MDTPRKSMVSTMHGPSNSATAEHGDACADPTEAGAGEPADFRLFGGAGGNNLPLGHGVNRCQGSVARTTKTRDQRLHGTTRDVTEEPGRIGHAGVWHVGYGEPEFTAGRRGRLHELAEGGAPCRPRDR